MKKLNNILNNMDPVFLVKVVYPSVFVGGTVVGAVAGYGIIYVVSKVKESMKYNYKHKEK